MLWWSFMEILPTHWCFCFTKNNPKDRTVWGSGWTKPILFLFSYFKTLQFPTVSNILSKIIRQVKCCANYKKNKKKISLYVWLSYPWKQKSCITMERAASCSLVSPFPYTEFLLVFYLPLGFLNYPDWSGKHTHTNKPPNQPKI